MRKFLLAATVLSLAAAPAFAQPDRAQGGMIAGNLALTAAGSNAGVSSEQGTMAGAKVAGNGAVIVGTVSGNYTAVDTTAKAKAKAGLGYAKTETTATQTNIGGTVSGGLAVNNTGRQDRRGNEAALSVQGNNGASGMTGGAQNSQAMGGSVAGAADLGGFIKVEQPKQNRPGRPR